MVRNAKFQKYLNDELNGKAGSKHQCRGGAWYTEVLQNYFKQENPTPTFCNFWLYFFSHHRHDGACPWIVSVQW